MKRRLSAILAADMVGYSRLVEVDEIGTLERHRAFLDEIIAPAIDSFNGRLVKEMGDGILSEFPSVIEAVRCAIHIQRKLPLHQQAASDHQRIDYRIGINLGDIVAEGQDILGDGVNVAARLEALADPGGVCISGTVFDHLKSQIDATIDPLGEVKVKNIETPIRVYKVRISESQSNQPTPKPRTRRTLIASAGLLISILVGTTIYYDLLPLWSNPTNVDQNDSRPVKQNPSIAVFPFDNLSNQPQQIYFADGLAADIITDLSKISGLVVLAQNTTFQYRGEQKKVVDVGRKLGASHVLEGSVQRADNRLRINAQLIDLATGTQIWAERYDGDASEVFELQDRVTKQILDAMQLELSVREQRAVDRHETENPVAYDHYLQGLRLISERRRLAVEENDLALAAFEKAIALDPNYSGAYAGLGWAKWLRVEQIDVFDEYSRQDAFRLARKSIELNDNAMARRILAREHLSVLNFWVSTTKNVSEAVAQLEQAYALQPNNSDILADLALVLSFAGQPERALRLSKEAMERNPNHPAWYFASSGIALLLSGDAERALSDLSKWNESDQLYGVSYIFLAAALANAGRKIEANTTLHRFEELSNTITLSSEQKSGPFEIRITSYAVKRRWPMQPAQEKVFIDGLKIAGMRDIQG